MHSIHVRLKILYVVIVTVVLAIFGTYSQIELRNELESRNLQLQQGVMTRLQSSLPPALWELDQRKIGGLLEGEMLPREVLAIRVLDTNDKIFGGRMRDEYGQVVPAPRDADVGGDIVEGELIYRRIEMATDASREDTVGWLVINFSRQHIVERLHAEVVRKVTEILLLDLALVVALSLSLRMVFNPLKRLRDGLYDLATREADEVQPLPENRRDEFGEVVHGFNRILIKLKATIERTRKAEEEAKCASTAAAKAYEELRQAQDSLVQAERLASLGGLVAGVAHEINTPVGITLTSASVLAEATDRVRRDMQAGAMKKSDLLTYLDTAGESTQLIMANANRAAQLIQSFKQIAVDQTHEERRSFALRDYIEEVVTSLHPRIKKTRVTVEIDCDGGVCLDSYPGAFAQVLTNLTMNALIHAFGPDDDGCITIRVRQQGGCIELVFSDNGRGISPEHLDKVFDPFFTTQRGQGGTGLGLNIVYNLVAKQFGGTIAVASTPGQGTQFTIRFPSTAPQQEAA
ncbi:MAG TPA: ATP-binding protein [Noviherbaspirillum sp.]|nr:ATP-binding protein [Noviherbaspirillum sp.]